MAITVIPLKCPDCAGILSGFEQDQIFFCPYCPSGWEISEQKLKRVKLSYARAKKIPTQFQMLFYLPFYLYRLKLEVSSEKMVWERILRIVQGLTRVYVSGFQLMRESYFGELGLLYTEAKVELEEDRNGNKLDFRRIGSASRAFEEAEIYLKHYPLLIIDKRQDITGIDFRVSGSFERIWAVPFFDLGNQIQDGILGKTFSSFALSTIDEFRQMRD